MTTKGGTNNEAEERDSDPSIKFGDLISFISTDSDIYFFGDGVRGRCVGKDKKKGGENFSEAIFKIQPRYEYQAQKSFKKYQKAEKEKNKAKDKDVKDKDKLKESEKDKGEKLEQQKKMGEQVELEKKLNDQEDAAQQGHNLSYGQVIQLLHISSNCYLAGNGELKANLDTAANRLELKKDGGSQCWFIVLPKFKVRGEGEKVQRGDQILLVHTKTRQFVQLDLAYRFEEDNLPEINLAATQTSWLINHYAPFVSGTSNLVKGGAVVRLFNPEHESTIYVEEQSDIKETRVCIRQQSKKDISFSNDIFQIVLRNAVQGGTISWKTGCRLRHIGSDLYLAVSKDHTRKVEKGKLEDNGDPKDDIDLGNPDQEDDKGESSGKKRAGNLLAAAWRMKHDD